MSCAHPDDVTCTRCIPRPARTLNDVRCARIDAVALGHLWYGGEAGKAKHDALMLERAALLAGGGS